MDGLIPNLKFNTTSHGYGTITRNGILVTSKIQSTIYKHVTMKKLYHSPRQEHRCTKGLFNSQRQLVDIWKGPERNDGQCTDMYYQMAQWKYCNRTDYEGKKGTPSGKLSQMQPCR